jgi:hypothetical protein
MVEMNFQSFNSKNRYFLPRDGEYHPSAETKTQINYANPKSQN